MQNDFYSAITCFFISVISVLVAPPPLRFDLYVVRCTYYTTKFPTPNLKLLYS